MQDRTRRDRVRSPMGQRRVQITQARFVEESNQKQKRRSEDELGPEQLHCSAPGLNSIREISSDRKVEQTCQQYEDMSSAIQQSWAIRHASQVVVVFVHVLACQ